MPLIERTTRAMRHREMAIADLHGRVSFPAQLTHRLYDFGHPSPVSGVVITQTTAIGIDRQAPDTRYKISIGDKSAPLPFLAKAEIFDCDEHGNREAVIRRQILDIGGNDFGFRVGDLAGANTRGDRQVHF
jgi:hypothetical protein